MRLERKQPKVKAGIASGQSHAQHGHPLRQAELDGAIGQDGQGQGQDGVEGGDDRAPGRVLPSGFVVSYVVASILVFRVWRCFAPHSSTGRYLSWPVGPGLETSRGIL